MKRQILISLIVLLSVAGLARASDPNYKAGELLVRFAEIGGQTPGQAVKNSILNSILPGCFVLKEYHIVPGLALVKLPSSTTVENAVLLFNQSSSILYAEPNYKLKLAAIPDDTRFGELHAMHNTGQAGGTADADIDAPEAWDIATGSSDIIVAVTDTGVDYTHPDLAANMWVNTAEQNGTPGVDDDGNGYIDDIYGYDFGDDDSDPMDDSLLYAGHGTHVSGTIGAVGNNGEGVAGVCWNVRIMACKIADFFGFIWEDAALSAIEYAVDNSANVMNASWGYLPGTPFIQSLYDVIEAAGQAGILFVAAAMNEDNDNDSVPTYPASFDLDNIISVMATNHNDNRTYYSSYGATTVDLAAPGGEQYFIDDPRGILSTVPEGGYEFYQGTSMATPHVVGACALLWSAGPSLTYTEIKDILLNTVDKVPALQGLCVSEGRLNLFKAVKEIEFDTIPPEPDPAEWDIEPTATGVQTIAMEAKRAIDRSGVEYYFNCVTDSNFDSDDWQTSSAYNTSGFAEGATYTFRVKARDKSEAQNETDWSIEKFTTTASPNDILPPAPNPSRWAMAPRKRGDTMIGMAAKLSTDENAPVQYYFECTSGNAPNSVWQTSTTYTIPGLAYDTYTFRVRARDTLNNLADWSVESSVTLTAPPRRLEVPNQYLTIQSAINDANDGDVVVVHPNRDPGTSAVIPYTGPGNYNIDFSGLAITVRCEDPEEDSIVANTIIDCQQNGRAFILHSGEGPNSVISGFTIINATVVHASIGPGTSGADANGGAIACFGGASPTISHCVIRDCVAAGQNGSDGANGDDGDDGDDGDPCQPGAPGDPGNPGGDGGDGGFGYGGAMYFDSNSSPSILYCTIINSRAIGGDGGRGGDGGNGGNGGDAGEDGGPGGDGGAGGDGGDAGMGSDALGGAIYFGPGCRPIIEDCNITDCNTIQGLGNVGGNGGNGGSGGAGSGDGDGAEGAGGNGGNAAANGLRSWAGAIYYDANCQVAISDTVISNSGAVTNVNSYFYTGGTGGAGNPLGSGGGSVLSVTTSLGGGNYYGPNCLAVLADCEITSNSAANGGGEYYDSSCTAVLFDTSLTGNVAAVDGGGIYCANSIAATLVNCNISNNNSISGFGGGIYYDFNDTLSLTGCDVSGNMANAGFGGGIFAGTFTAAPATTVNISDCNISGNLAEFGGGMHLIGTNLTIDSSAITGNTGEYGGGVYWLDSDANISDCTVSGNIASEGAHCSGAGFYCLNSSAAIKNCVFTGNQADGFAGAIFFGGPGLPPLYDQKVTNCLITDNTAFFDGAGLYSASWAWPIITNCTIVGNEVLDEDNGSGGGVSCRESDVDIVSSILWDNTAVYGPQIAIGDPLETNNPAASVLALYSDVQGGADDVFVGQAEDPEFGPWLWLPVPESILDQNPMFVRTSLTDPVYNYYLSHYQAGQILDPNGDIVDPNVNPGDANSPCIDTGDPASTLDTANLTTRTDHVPDTNIVDMGYHYRISPPVNQYELNISVVNPEGGSLSAEGRGGDPFIIGDPNTQLVRQGTIVSLHAEPNLNWVVKQWTDTDNDAITDVNNIVTMNGDKVVTVEFIKTFKLTILIDPNDGGVVLAEPAGPYYRPGTVVTLTAQPNPGYRLKRWIGTDDDASLSLVNTVTINADKTVMVDFEPAVPAQILVPWPVPTIEEAITIARDGDVIIVSPKPDGTPYTPSDPCGFDFHGRKITLMSVAPYDPCVVAKTIIDCQGSKYVPRRAFQFHSGEDNNSILGGFTIKNGFMAGPIGCYGCVPQEPPDPNDPNDRPANGGGDAIGDNYGGAIFIDNASPKILNCVITNCTVAGAVGGDGAWGLNGDDREGTNDGQEGGPGGNGDGNGYGGGIYVGPNSAPIIKGCTILKSIAQGGIGSDGGGGGNAVEGGLAGGGGDGGWGSGDGHGAAIYTAADSNPTIIDCIFNESYTTGGTGGQGGIMGTGNREVGGDIVIWPGFGGLGEGVGYGGAACAAENSAPDFNNCSFNANRARGYEYQYYFDFNAPGPNYPLILVEQFPRGGAIYCDANSNVSLAGCEFTNNYLGDTFEELYVIEFYTLSAFRRGLGNGGALYAANRATLNITDSAFLKNSSFSEAWNFLASYEYEEFGYYLEPFYRPEEEIGCGGAIYLEPNTIAQLHNTLIGGNKSRSDGGGIYSQSNKLTLTECTIGGNAAIKGNAGGIYLFSPKSTTLTMTCCTITENFADRDGGGGYWKDLRSDSKITDCYFLNNNAKRAAALAVAASAGDFNDCVFSGNVANGDTAGGLWLLNFSGKLRNSTFVDNRIAGLGGEGGALSIYGNQPQIKNCLFAGNSTRDKGGAITSIYSNPTVVNCTFSDNTTDNYGGGIYCDNYSTLTIKNSIFAHCNSSAVYNNNTPGNLTIIHSLFWENYGSDFHNFIDVPDNNNLFADPVFVDDVHYDFHLKASSPCFDAGSGTAVYWQLDKRTTRQDNAPDTGIVDIGYHYIASPKQYQLTVQVISGHGTVTPGEGLYYQGSIVTLTANPDPGYRVENWTGTANDGSTSKTVLVVMNSDKLVTVRFALIKTIRVPANYPTIQRAIDAAKDSDIIELAPGTYDNPWGSGTAYYQMYRGGIVIWGKNITLTSTNPDDPYTVANTIIHGMTLYLLDVGPETVIAGLTISDTSWFAGNGIDECPGQNGGPIWGGAIDLVSASPTIINVVIDGISIRAGDGGNGLNCPQCDYGHQNGGWGGSAYGGAIRMQNSSPILKGVTFANCTAYGGNGGNGGDCAPSHGGRGGSWMFSDPNSDWTYWQGYWQLGWEVPEDRYGNPRYDIEVDDEGNIIAYIPYGLYDEYWFYTAMGGAVYIDANSSPKFIKCNFTNNRTVGGFSGVGGVWSMSPSNNERIESFGAAVYCEPGSSPTFINCSFNNNIADGDIPLAENHSFYTTLGGAICYGTFIPEESGGSLKLINCAFNDNFATTGGALYSAYESPTMENCNFNGNQAYDGGAAYYGDCFPTIVESTFTQNAAGYVYGGDVNDANLYYTLVPDVANYFGLMIPDGWPDFLMGPPTTDVLGQGGAVFCASSPARITDSNFTENTSTGSGGAAYLEGDLNSPDANSVIIHNTLFTRNSTVIDGGAITTAFNVRLKLTNCTLTENEVSGVDSSLGYGGGLAATYNSYVTVTDSIIWGNNASLGREIAVGAYDPNGNYFIEDNSILTVSYSDIWGEQQEAFIRPGDPNTGWPGGTLNWLAGNMHFNPLFVNGYYLSQSDTGDPNQMVLSPCVDAGSDDAYSLGLYRHTTRTDWVLDSGIVDMGYHYLIETDLLGDFNFDGVVDASDLAMLLFNWLNEGCGFPSWCNGTDLNQDGRVNNLDYAIFLNNYGEIETTPPQPDPMTWAVPPRSSGTTSVIMTATTAFDNSTGYNVEYYFECTATDADVWPAIINSGWQLSPTWEHTGLVTGKTYWYRVKARDLNYNETEWSIEAYAVAGQDTTPPITDPAADNPYKSEWAVLPAATGPNSIIMTVVAATDDTGPVEYYFEFVASDGNDGHDSAWREARTYEDTGLDPNTTYTYRVRARDQAEPRNYGYWSDANSATTSAEGQEPDPNALTPDPSIIEEAIQWKDPNYPYDYHHAIMAAVTDAVNGPVEYYFECSYNSYFDSGWIDTNVYDVAVAANRKYWLWRVRARDANGVLTAWSDWVLVVNGSRPDWLDGGAGGG